ncbi:hypothetical protein PF003_g9943 [Phytophthora fragariae]|nr:hypothetical protein PF003_g9943 [Phytophthora fragariae]
MNDAPVPHGPHGWLLLFRLRDVMDCCTSSWGVLVATGADQIIWVCIWWGM